MTFQGSGSIGGSSVSGVGSASGGGGLGGGSFGGGGGGGRIAMGGGVGLIITLIALFLGMNPSLLGGSSLTGGGSTSSNGDSAAINAQLQACTYEKANAGDPVCLIKATVESVNTVWSQVLPGYTEPQTHIFEGSVNTGCGAASSDMGPFYCPADQTAYFDVSFFKELVRMGGSNGPLAQEYVVAHEYGHHVENLLQVLAKGQRMGNDGSVRIELQADCLAGVWMHHAQSGTGNGYLAPVTQEQVDSVVQTAKAIGDDTIQGARSNPEGWTHGSAAQRSKWVMVGLKTGDYQQCNTFATNDL